MKSDSVCVTYTPRRDQLPTGIMSIARRVAGLLLCGAPALHAQSHGDTIRIDIKGFAFKPASVVATRGAVVEFLNGDDIEHTVTFGSPEARDSRLESRSLTTKGTTHVVRTRKAGTYAFYCERHPFMTGHITVKSKR